MKLPFINTVLFVVIASILLSSCGTSNKFASSFGKRKYTKGYYVDVAGTVPVPKSKEVKHPDMMPLVITPAQNVSEVVPKPILPIVKPVEKHIAIAISKPANSNLNPNLNLNKSPIVNAVTNGNGGTHSTSNDSNGSGNDSIRSFIYFMASVLDIILFVLLAIIFSISGTTLFAVLLTLSWLTLDIIAMVFAIKAVSNHESNLVFAWIVIGFNILYVLYIVESIFRSNI
jgi:hypothetical protein